MILYRDKALNTINSCKDISKCWLVFGSDGGEIKVLTQKIIAKVKSEDHELKKVNTDANISQLFIERSLFQSNKIIVIEDASDTSTKAIEECMLSVGQNDYLIVCGGELKKNSKLRTLFESHEACVAVNCYNLDSYAIAINIDRELRANGIKFDKEIPQMILNLISNDSQIIQNEIQKIVLFLSDSLDKKLTSELLIDILSVNAEASLDILFMNIILNKKKEFVQEFKKTSQLNDIFIIRAYQNFLVRIISVQKQLWKIGIENAMNSLKPPLFGKQRSDFIAAVQQSDMMNNIKLLNEAIETECILKTSATTQTLIFQNILEQLCKR
jgi:DNA polymerase III delta subunit